ncbi:MAG: TRAP transporter TAXI family solute receptor [Candidatus Binatia bacterium]|jgi:TRAP transporter TAXI family solute receptor
MKKITKREFLTTSALGSAALITGCGGGGGDNSGGGGGSSSGSGKRQFVTIGTAPVGGMFFTVGGAIAEVLDANQGANNWKVAAEASRGSQENIRLLTAGEQQVALSNSSISYFAVRGEGGWDKKYDINVVTTMFPLVAQFVTKKGSGINSIADLKGKRVVVGPEGAGFEYFLRPLLEAHGVTYKDFEPVYAGQQTSTDYLGDGNVAATFLGGGVPLGSITSASSTMDIAFVPYDAKVKEDLIKKYAFFGAATIPGGTYKGIADDFAGMNVGSAHLICAANADEELIYQLTKTLFENRASLAEKAKPGKSINEKNSPRNTGVDFHPGAIRFYKEKGFWPEAAAK